MKALGGNKRERRLNVATWNFQGWVVSVNRRKLESCISWSGTMGKGGQWNKC